MECVRQFSRNGFAIFRSPVSDADLASMAAAFPTCDAVRGVERRVGMPFGFVEWLADHHVLTGLASRLADKAAMSARARNLTTRLRRVAAAA